MNPTTTERIRVALLGGMAALVLALGPTDLAAATPDPDEPPAEEPAPEEPEEPADTTPTDDAEATPEPGGVSPGVWIGTIALVVFAVAWATRQTTKASSGSSSDVP